MIDQSYKEKLQLLDKLESEQVILNDNKSNAQDLFEQLIGNAQKEINILSEKLLLYNTEAIVDLLKKVTKKGVQVKILLDGKKDEMPEDNKFLAECITNEKCEIRVSDHRIESHIITRDDKAYRYCSVSDGHKAIASFNGAKVVDNAKQKIFDDTKYKQYKQYKQY